jgi:PAS domain S-box-containing protein
MHLSSWPVACLALASGIEIVLAILAITRVRIPAARPFALGMALASVWSLIYALDLSSADLPTKIFLLQLRFVFIPFIGPVWFEAAYRIVHSEKCLAGWRLGLALVVPVASAVLSWVHPPIALLVFHDRLWLDTSHGIPILRFASGPWGIVFYGYTFAMIGSAIVILWASVREASWDKVVRRNFGAAFVLAAALNLAFVLNLSPTPGLNYGPIFAPIACAMAAYALVRARMFHLAPIARSILIESLEEMIVVLDGAGRIIDLNRAASVAIGRTLETALGRPVSEVLSQWPDVVAALGPGAAPKTEVRIGEVVHELRILPIAGPDPRAQARIVTLRDLTDRKQIEAEFQRAKETAEAADQAKSRFLAMMSHEIRTPMNAVVGFTHLLGSTSVTAEQQQYLDLIQQAGRGLLVVIDDVLDYTKISSGQLSLEEAPCRIAELAQQACNLLAPRAQQRGISLEWSATADVPQVIVGDAVRIGQILTNLIGNAIKFTEKGGVRLRVSRVPGERIRPAGRNDLILEVSDTGIGIAPEALDRIFRPFGQADDSITRKFGGTGLGLAISRRLCEVMGGGLTVSSEPGKGSVFTARIAVRFPGDHVGMTPAPAAPDWSALPERPLRVLVIEDNPLNQRVIGALLKKLGHGHVFASNGRDGLDLLERERFDIVLLDIEMPDMDGYETVRQLRQREAGTGRRQLVVAVTAHAMSGVREQCLAAGMDDFLTKPIDPNLLRDALRRHAGR